MNQRSGIDHHHIYSTETKEEENGGRDILPLEMEDGRKAESAPPAEVKKRGFCARHKGKLIFLGIVALILIALAIAIPLLMPKDPTATLLEQSNLRLDGLGAGSATIDLTMKVQNPNPYAIAFEDLRLGRMGGKGKEREALGCRWHETSGSLNVLSAPPHCPRLPISMYPFLQMFTISAVRTLAS